MAKVGVVLGVIVGVLAVILLIAGIALYRPDIPFETLEAKYAVPTSKYADLPGGVRMHYREDGDPTKPVVVLVHGYGDSFLTWDAFIKRLAPDFRVITLDLPGHGLTRTPPGYLPGPDSYADLVDALAAKLNLPPFAIVGNSMGGGVAWQVAVRHPQRLNGLVLMDAAGWPATTLTKPPLAFRLIQTPLGIFLLKHIETRPITGPALKADVVDKSLITPAFLDRDILMGMNPGRTPATAEALGKLTVPTLVIHGEKDVIIQPESARKFAAAIPGAKLILYPDVGHLPQFEIPDRSAADVAAFLKAAQTPVAKEPV